MEKLENQWRSLANFSFTDICTDLKSDIKTIDIVFFWSCILSLKDASGRHPFKELALFVLKCLTLPISNAIVERIFSFMSALKTKQRNKIQIDMLSALLTVRVYLKVNRFYYNVVFTVMLILL